MTRSHVPIPWASGRRYRSSSVFIDHGVLRHAELAIGVCTVAQDALLVTAYVCRTRYRMLCRAASKAAWETGGMGMCGKTKPLCKFADHPRPWPVAPAGCLAPADAPAAAAGPRGRQRLGWRFLRRPAWPLGRQVDRVHSRRALVEAPFPGMRVGTLSPLPPGDGGLSDLDLPKSTCSPARSWM